MFSKINFTYKKPSHNSKSYLISREQLVKQKIKENETKSLIDCIHLQNKVDSKKLQNTNNIFEQSSEKTDYYKNNDNIIEIKLNDSSTINTGIIDDVNKPEIILNEEEIRKIQEIKNKYINHLSESVDEGNFDVESSFSFIDKNYNNYIDPEMYDNMPVPFNVGRIHKRGIEIINNVYQSKYDYGKENSTGLGDFLRGSYFILEFCEKYNFQPRIVFNNCISNFLLIKTHNLERVNNNILKGIRCFKNNNFKEYVIENDIIHEPFKDIKNIMADFVEYVLTFPQYSGNVFIFCNSFPIDEIPEKNKEYMRKFLEPTNEIKLIINQTLGQLAISSKQYIVIHIRSGDSYLKGEKNAFTNGYVHTLINNIKNDLKNYVNRENNYLLIADSNDIKKIIQNYFPNFKILIKPITHFGEGIVLEEEKVKNTLIDFYLLSHSKRIFSYSAYKHGSGFSYWCAKTFNIPYVCKYIQ